MADALAAAEPDDVVVLGEGRFGPRSESFPLRIPASVTLKGMPGAVIDGTGVSFGVPVVDLSGDESALEGVEVTGAPEPFFVLAAPAVTIERVAGCCRPRLPVHGAIVAHGGTGHEICWNTVHRGNIALQGCDESSITGNRQSGLRWGSGIEVNDGTGHRIDANEIDGDLCAVRMRRTVNAHVTGNRIEGRWWGVHLEGAVGTDVSGNRVTRTMRAYNATGGRDDRSPPTWPSAATAGCCSSERYPAPTWPATASTAAASVCCAGATRHPAQRQLDQRLTRPRARRGPLSAPPRVRRPEWDPQPALLRCRDQLPGAAGLPTRRCGTITDQGEHMPGWNYAESGRPRPRRCPMPWRCATATAITWAEFDRRANGIARTLLDAGASEQDKVAQYLYNAPEYLESMYGVYKAGLVPVNTNYRYADDELVYLWDNADAVAVVFHGTFTERIEGIRSRVPNVRTWLWVDDGSSPCPDWAVPYEDAAAAGTDERVAGPWGRDGHHILMMYTGGTTGMPKGVMWRHDDLIHAVLYSTNPLFAAIPTTRPWPSRSPDRAYRCCPPARSCTAPASTRLSSASRAAARSPR